MYVECFTLEKNIDVLDFLEKLQEHPENFRITAVQSKSLRRFFKKDCVNEKTGEILDSSKIRAFVDFDKVAEYKNQDRDKSFHVGHKCRYIFSKSCRSHKHWKNLMISNQKMESKRAPFCLHKWQTRVIAYLI